VQVTGIFSKPFFYCGGFIIRDKILLSKKIAVSGMKAKKFLDDFSSAPNC